MPDRRCDCTRTDSPEREIWMPVDQHEMAMLRAEAEHEQAMARSREITDEMSRCYWDVIDECAGSLRPVGHHVSAWMRAALEAALGQEKHE